jgi:hypothetical protein
VVAVVAALLALALAAVVLLSVSLTLSRGKLFL